jgi:phosphoribosyl-ATP pyrophosphohydrolase
MNKLIKRSYESIQARNLITDKTTLEDFNNKLIEEFNETQIEFESNNLEKYIHEGFDLVNVFFNFCYHNGIDINKKFEEIIIKNENRKD